MATTPVNFTTGPALLADVGLCEYNGCIFSPLFESNIHGEIIKDDANRTTKFMEYTIQADGYVTLPTGATDIAPTMATLRRLLTAQGGYLIYRGRGFDLTVNATGANLPAQPGVGGGLATAAMAAFSKSDVAWGPVPKLLDFQPLGGGLSAKVKWQVVTRVVEVKAGNTFGLLQLNFESAVTYGEDGYSSLSVRGVIEIPMTRQPSQTTRTLGTTVDNLRATLNDNILRGIDLSRFRVTRREFKVSRDKRTLEWLFEAEEKPYMDLPPGCTIARGGFTVRPAKAGMGLCMWHCNLKATYTLRADAPHKEAWYAFLNLLRLRMVQSVLGTRTLPAISGGNQNPPPVQLPQTPAGGNLFFIRPFISQFNRQLQQVQASPPPPPPPQQQQEQQKAWLIDFNFDEGLYLDSKTISFSATWKLATTLNAVLEASGLWKKVSENDAQGNNLWATAMRDISGIQSWLPNQLNPNLDVIVDFGGP